MSQLRRAAGTYCANCGQKKAPEDLTLGELVRETAQELTNLEGKVPSTLKVLLLQPGRLTSEFLAGRRARWIAPLRLYLICNLFYFVSGPISDRLSGRVAREVARITVTSDNGAELTAVGWAEMENTMVGCLFGRERRTRAEQACETRCASLLAR